MIQNSQEYTHEYNVSHITDEELLMTDYIFHC